MNSKTTKKNHIPSIGRVLLFVLFCFGLWVPGQYTLHAQMGFQPSLDDATFEKYNGLLLVSRIHIARAYLDHEKWGFFKLGLAPIGVMDGVRVQILSADSITNALETLNACNIPSAATHRMEFRNLEISLLGEKASRLRAESARIGRPDTLELSHVLVTNDPLGTISISHATLQVSGPDCGRLSWEESHNHKQLFVFNSSKTTL
ncbi:MAG TPA: hypothetical protein VK811_00600 [Candidatus Acidoferrum sp.]|nr:hypothetical protein [Candidatus Acidoferrum sp.]